MSTTNTSRVIRLTGFIPMIPPDDDESDPWVHRYEVLQREILELSGKVEVFRDVEITRGSRVLNFRYVKASQCPPVLRNRGILYLEPGLAKILRIDVDFTLAKPLPKPRDEYLDDQTHVALEIRKLLNHLLLIANIAKPGSLQLGEGVVLAGGRLLLNTQRLLTDFVFSEEHVRTIGWPPLADLPIDQVLAWYPYESVLQATSPPTGPLVRAINALSYLFGETGPESGVSVMLYSLIGLESLYTDHHDGIAEQINSKAQIFLGPMTAFKKELKQMYHIRSRFLHGDLDFPSSFDSIRQPSHPGFTDIERSADLSSMLLIATLQRMCEQRLTQLRFRLVHDGNT